MGAKTQRTLLHQTNEPSRRSSSQPVINGVADLVQSLYGDKSEAESEPASKRRKTETLAHNSERSARVSALDFEIKYDVDFSILEFVTYRAFHSVLNVRLSALSNMDSLGYSSADYHVNMLHGKNFIDPGFLNI
jgi:hypothetical protein